MATKKPKDTEPQEAEIVEEEIIKTETHYSTRQRGSMAIFWGFALVALGSLFLLQNSLGINAWLYFWPILLVLFGLSLMLKGFRR